MGLLHKLTTFVILFFLYKNKKFNTLTYIFSLKIYVEVEKKLHLWKMYAIGVGKPLLDVNIVDQY